MEEHNVTSEVSSNTLMAHLINDLGQCFALSSEDSKNHRFIHQWNCMPTTKGQLWCWNNVSLGSGNKHLSNAFGKCVSVRGNDSQNPDIFQWDYLDGAEGQRFDFF